MKRTTNKTSLVVLGTLLVVAMGLFLQSCSNEEDFEGLSDYQKERIEFETLVLSNTTLDNNKYQFQLTLNEALENGMSEAFYNEIIKELYFLNEEMQKALNDPEVELIIENPSKQNVIYENPRLKTSSESGKTAFGTFRMYEGSLSGSGTFTIPSMVSTIYVGVYTKCLGHSVTVKIAGKTLQFTSFWLLPSLKEVSVTSGGSYKVEASTSCSGGGGVTLYH